MLRKMPADKINQSLGSSKMPKGFQSKVVAPRNPKLVREEEKAMTLTPSAFLKEMSLTTEQKLASTHEMRLPQIIKLLDMSETSHQKFSTVDVDQSLFQPFPSEVVFQNYTPCEIYEVPLILRNNDKVPRLVKVVLESSPYFKVISPNDIGHKVAPGMPSTFRILFTPEDNKDYFHQLTCITEREKFIIPIRAIGARGILDFPDQLNFSTCPVKYSTQKTLLVRNIGNREAHYQITTQSPFSVEPSIGTLGMGETMQLMVEFQPQKIGDHSKDLIVNYDTGEDIHISMYGAATDVNIRLNKNSLTIEKAYITLANQRSVVLHNRSDIIAHFQWKVFATQEEEDQQKQRLCYRQQTQEDNETDLFLKECSADPTLRERLSILSDSFQNHGRMVQGDSMLFSDNIFTIEPVEGDVWPNSTAEINVIFKPREARVYQQTVYCDISGRETRLPLRIRGEGMGPKLIFSFDQLDIGKIFVGSTHSYEAILSNKGAIDALFNLIPASTALGSCFTFDPKEGIILPGGLQTIQISFSSTILGEFTEEFRFNINGSPKSVNLTISGCVIGPTFHFSVPYLNFGDVSFGFPRTLSCCLCNTSLVPMTFNLRIPGDGPSDPSVTSFVQISDITRPSWRKGPQGNVKSKEFTILPSSGTIRPQGFLDIQVTLCSNTVKKYETALVVDIDGIGEEVLALLITARCVVPPLHVVNPVVKFGRCFLKYPYQQMVTLINDNDLSACYGVLPQEFEENPTVLYSSPVPCGIIQPHSSVEIPLALESQVTGEQDTTAYIAVFGSKESPLKIHLVSTGEGPVIYVYPAQIDFGNIQVLKDISRTLHLSNQTVIPAWFRAQMACNHSTWRIEPSEGVVPPETEIPVTLIANLDDTMKFQDKVNLIIENSKTYVIPVQATGIGTTIVTNKPFAPEFNLGPHFSLDPCSYHFKITNCGRRTHQLYWTTEGFPPFRQHNHAVNNTKSKNSPQSPESPSPVFKLQPLRMELTPGKSMDMILEGFSNTPKVVKERLICHAIIGKQSGKERIMTVDVACEFIAPVLHLSSKEITFRVEKHPSDVLTPQFEPLILKNISSLPLSALLSVREPFYLCDMDHQMLPAEAQPMKLVTGEEQHLSIRFDPAYKDDLNSRVAEEVLFIKFLEHPHEEQVTLRGEVHFPNLHFQTMYLDFGCILNDTEDMRYIEMTNYSPLLVKYRWSFLTDDHGNQIRFNPAGHKSLIELEPTTEQEAQTELQPAPEHADSFVRDAGMKKHPNSANEEEMSPKEPANRTASTEIKLLTCGAKELDSISLTRSPVELDESLCLEEPEELLTTGVEEVFDILPLYGILQPNDIQQVSFSFYGHADIAAHATALCEVEGGPTYEIKLSGEASLVRYMFNIKEINYGMQLFDQVLEAEIILKNSGKVGFDFTVLNSSQASVNNPPPGVPLVLPAVGYIESEKEQVLKVYYLPGVPEVFQRTFQIQVAHLESESITLKGEGTFPRICLDLPRNIRGNEKYENVLKEAKQNMEQEPQRDEGLSHTDATAAEPPVDNSSTMLDTWLQMEVERLLIQEHALEQEKALTCDGLKDTAVSQRTRRKLVKAQLPEYILDFGYIILGDIRTHIVKITNTSQFPVSFQADRRTLHDRGFSIELDRVKNLPYCETETFEVRFDPRSANLPLGEVEVLLPIKVVGGPTFHICLRANVIMPSLCISSDKLEFSSVQCGECQIETIQLHNQLQVTCEWFITTNEHIKKVDKHLPLSLRQKLRQEFKSKPRIFEVIPSSGILAPGERLNLQVKFAPAEERFYSNQLTVHISQSSQRLPLLVSGHGLEPRLEFNPSVLELGPMLPYSIGDEAEVVVKNPCKFPIEFYSLEFDQQYLAEEKILRMLKGYDSHNILLLPPRTPGEKLPPEVLECYNEQKKIQDEQAKTKMVEAVKQENDDEDSLSLSEHGAKHYLSESVHTASFCASVIRSASLVEESRINKADSKLEPDDDEEEDFEKENWQSIDGSCQTAVGELDNNPVSRAIARHLGIDISPEGRAARNRRGIVIIVHGAPLTGKTSAAVSLARHYSTACLSIDSVVMEAISDRSSSAGLRARELCIKATIEQAQREAEEAAGQSAELSGVPPPLSTRLSIEALAKHTSEGSQQSSESKTGPQSVTSRGYRGSTATGRGRSEGHASLSQKQQQQQQQQQHQSDQTGSQVPSSPVPSAPVQRRLSISASVAGEVGLMSCILPDDLLVEILSERMQLSDCYQGVVFDGLETLFTRSMSSALLCLLKAINNRRYIFFVNLFQDYVAMKAREKAKLEQEEWEKNEAIAREKARLQEMNEEEYDALTEEQKIQFDNELLQALRERKRREMEKLARELEEKRQQQELERLREEEEMKKKSKRWKREISKEKDEPSGKKSQLGSKQVAAQSTTNKSDFRLNEGVERKVSTKDRPDSVSNDKEEKKKRSKLTLQEVVLPGTLPPPIPEQEEMEKEVLSDSEKSLAQRFKVYDAAQKDITQILLLWDRAQGILLPPPNLDETQHEAEDQRQAPSGRKGRKDRERERQERLEKERAEKERLEKERAEKERLEKLKALEDSRVFGLEKEVVEGADKDQEGKKDVGVPCLEFQVLSSEESSGKRILESGRLPEIEQILDGLGLGPSGPPIPPTAFFSVISYPERRAAPVAGEALKHFAFIVPEDVSIEEEKKDAEGNADGTISVPTMKEEQATPTKGRQKKDKAEPSREAQKDKRSTGRSRKGLPGTAPGPLTPLTDLNQNTMSGGQSQEKFLRLSSFRWVVPAHGEVTLKIHFSSIVPGQFDQTLNFEILGTCRQYQIYLRGICTYPTISQDPRVVFPHLKKCVKPDDIIFKQYVMSTGVFHFGPLLCGKSRDRYKAVRYPSNFEKITILNISPLEAEVHFCFQHDFKANTYLLDPPTMTLKPNEKQELSIWAYPTSAGIFEDSIVCCIKENPEPVVFSICCQGVRPELELDRKQLHFEKLLLHRKDSKALFLKNSTPLPVAWRISGLENLGDDFSVPQDQGIIDPHLEFALQLNFRATKALNIKKTIRLEVSDAENILGIVQIENIQVHAEAYDVALDISFPKGTDGGLDFGVMRVLDEGRQQLSLKNKGKYEIGYSFILQSSEANLTNLKSLFTIQPQKGTLAAVDRPTQVQLTFHSRKEVKIEDKPILHCQVIEPNVCEGGETIASIPIRVSVSSLFSKYSISPASFINFGSMMNGTRKTCTFTLENKGALDFKFVILKLMRDVPILPRKGTSHLKHSRSRESDTAGKIFLAGKQSKRTDSLQKDINLLVQARLTLGMFTVYPGFGSIASGGQQVITVDCLAEPVGKCEEFLAIDITDKDPEDNPGGVPYTLMAESCLPAFVVDDIGSIFEEHRICNNINLYQILQTVEGEGVFVSDENKFIFTNVLVGHQATARFKISNVGKIPCDAFLAVKPISSKAAARINDIFEVDPVRMCIPSRSHAFATVTFTPQTMQSYQCIFEVSIDGQPSLVSKSRNLTFDIIGDGNLPRVTIMRPVLRNKRGNPLLLFKRLLLGHSEKLPFILKNSGVIPVQMMIDLLDEQGVFSLKAKPTTNCFSLAQNEEEESTREGRKPHTASLILHNGESVEFDVLFKPTMAQRVEGKIHLLVVDNQYEETNIQMVGEGYQDDITLDNIHGLVDSIEENAEGQLEDDIVEATKADHIQFGDCHIGKPYQVTFSITNHSKADVMRFEWPSGAPFNFSPQVGHLHAGCAKDITVTLKSSVPVTFKMHTVKCKVCRITFQLPADQVSDWDDRLHTVKWVDATRSLPNACPTKKKVIETDPEPVHTIVEDSSLELDLRLSAVIDYTQFKLETKEVQFKETLLFQTRMFKFKLANKGNVALEYSWKMVMEDNRRTVNFPEEPSPPSPEGEPPSATSAISTKMQSSRVTSQLGTVLESVVSFPYAATAHPPFSIEPSSGVITAGKKQLFQVKFSPLEVGEFEGQIICSIPNLKPNCESPVVSVKGRSLLPYCHFELEDSDYITANRRNPELRGPKGGTLDPNTRVIEFASVGVHARNRRAFTLTNPTSSTYSFQWTCEETRDLREKPVFYCLTEKGQIRPDKKVEVSFEFIPHHLGITESFWTFTVPEQNISVPFLLVGNTTDPSVCLDRSHLNYQSLLVGHEAHKTIQLINNENETFSFAFRDSSRYSEGYINFLTVQPMEGSVLPLSSLPVTILFTPALEGEVSFNLICDVKRKTQPLSLNVKAVGYSMNVSVRCEESNGLITELSVQETNIINLKEVEINEHAQCSFYILNTGKFNFSFLWEFSGPKVLRRYLTINPERGVVDAGGQAQALLTFHPLKTCTLKDIELKLQISNGPTFSCVLLASVVVPSIHFSFTKITFGTCFIYYAGMPLARKTLTITNKEDREISLDCLFSNTAHLEVGFQAGVLNPGEKIEVPITFYPREAVSYHEIIPFEINGLSQQTVEVLGKGSEMKIDVVEPQSKVVKFGALTVGQTMKKTVRIANNSVVPLTFNLTFMFTMLELQESKVLSLSPSSEITLKPKGDTCTVEVIFSPKCRIPQFTEEVMLECNGLARSLFMVRGCCQGIEVSLDQEHIPFGAVVQQSKASRRIIMQNTGDMGVKFKWDTKSFEPDFSISPVEGYISPGMDVPLEVTFHPCELSQEIYYDNLQCYIQGSKALKLSLSGCCVNIPMTKEILNFTCQVRGKHTQTIMLSNRSNQSWSLQPIIEGEQWKGPEFIRVEAHQHNKPYEITYRPLSMNVENKKHQGSIFFPIPDGTGLVYLLQGTAEPPKSSGSVIREVPCKTSYTELIPVSNWLNKPQRFHVIVDMIKPEKLDNTTALKGLDYLDVPASSKKDHKLTFFSYKEGLYSAKVTFRNEVTQEYLFYFVTFKAIPSGPISTIEMMTPVRQSISSSIKVENPLLIPVTFTTDCKVPDINLPPQFIIPAQSEGVLVFEFQPLKIGEVSGRLTLQSSDLGSFQYDLNLKAITGRPEKPLYFRTMLGSSQIITTKFINYTRQRVEYTTRIDCPDFHVDKVISAAPGSQGGTDVSVEIIYEPCQLGESRATLHLSSPIGGEYTFPLFGTSVSPKPQGPFQIKAGSSISIPFKNVFLQHTTFIYHVESPAFTIKASENIRSKKSISITVSFEGNLTGSKVPVTSRLVISCARAAHVRAGISWVYYLKGIMPEK
ncbi:hydrocephalus-inducing protein homolog [Alligator mississippiensis]|uniref:hydrocephalus-inducing protein homolog n=1 Tax=Alligator mississippiensis TaxID=8496 RepID=UPI002877B2C6|nr:hydrocephalus-inducing protein homolog [Alligator mississippiensis]XP_059569699.1 hydrocephalus-inducing protein homolog [Alligator mississippiensis]